jgi:single-stranded-DNA-specific exonuclease
MDRAVERIRRALRERQRILVWGDFDVDGQTATALLVSALRDLGGVIDYTIPNRLTEGHGLHLPRLLPLLNSIDLLLTCDTGIAAHEAVAAAGVRGVDVIITDHHSLPETLPGAHAVINPMRLQMGHPLRELPGVGTAYKLIEALYAGRTSESLLDLVAVGIVADVMVQVDDTRYLLQRGLAVLRRSERPAVRALLERTGIDPAYLTETDVAFAIAPRLNALGRLADANLAVELLISADPAHIAEAVNHLEGLNQKRRFLTRQVYAAAQAQIQDDPSLLKYAALVVCGAEWHTGVAGIVASRLVEDYGRPAIVLSEHDGLASGSARSVAGCDLVAALRTQAHLLTGFGGHAMAAGLRLPADRLYEFRRGLSGAVREALGSTAAEPARHIDGFVSLADIDLAFAEDIARLAPFGSGNPPLTLAARGLRIVSRRTLGSRGDHMALRVVDDAGAEARVIWWFADAGALPSGRFDLAYTVRPQQFDGKRTALIEWLDARPADGASIFLSEAPAYTVIDQRAHADPQAQLAVIRREQPDALVWREGFQDVEGVDRFGLRGAQTLVVWSPPASPLLWQALLDSVQPATLILFGVPNRFDQADTLLTQLAGVLKYAMQHKSGEVSLSEIAARLGHMEQTILAAFAWLQGHSPFRLEARSEDSYHVTRAHALSAPAAAQSERLERLLAETRAYRMYWLRQPFT